MHLRALWRELLSKNHWKFDCQCERCLDPTEFGTHLQAIKCKLCFEKEGTGFLLPVCSNNNEAVLGKVSNGTISGKIMDMKYHCSYVKKNN